MPREAGKSCFPSEPSAFLAWRKHSIPIAQEGKIIYIRYKETAEPESGRMFSSLTCSCWMTGCLSTAFSGCPCLYWRLPPNPNLSIGLCLPSCELPCLAYWGSSGFPSRAMVWERTAELHVPQMESCQDALALVHFLRKVQIIPSFWQQNSNSVFTTSSQIWVMLGGSLQ